ncbi:hypothetical protein CDD83_3830 [Cordyceps sp. RAO-2017]|nr:hypothetical protein CDD83_3830 [Cordyceps sp. RAO-2017]
MARFRGTRYLTCFYCGKRSGLKYDGSTRQFLCLYCEATNYLDENGDITDPPVATEREATTTRYAAPQPPSSSSSRTDSVFCPTCLKNQHLFTKSLAQYFPDDPSDPDFAQLERNYYRYRRGLEKRYPQVCDECADKVEARIRQAGYTAKTDYLRRMMDRSRGRKHVRARTALDQVDSLGSALWRGGFVLQLLWHLSLISRLLQQSAGGLRDPDDAGALATATAWLARLASPLPAPETLIRWSIATAMASIWWNPHFVQLNRGFTRHLLGFTQWYSFQGLIVFFRLVSRATLGAQGGHGQSTHAQLSAHAAMAALMSLIYVLAGRSIRVDTTPLFGTYERSAAPEGGAISPARKKQEATKTFSELFNDALESADNTPQRQQQPPPPRYSQHPSVPPSPPTPIATRQPVTRGPPHTPSLFGGRRGLPSETPFRPSPKLEYAEEMDWSPITPRHRAFADQPSPNKGVGGLAGPGEDKSHSPFWYRVPAAPVNPARRLRNPPRAPEPRAAPVETNKVLFTGRRPESSGSIREGGRGEIGASVEFRQPQFFAPERNDDASSLADLLSQSFSLSQDQDEAEATEEEEEAEHRWGSKLAASPGGSHSWGTPKAKTKRPPKNEAGHGNTWDPRLAGPPALAALLLLWLSTLALSIPRRTECQIAVMAAAGLIALGGQDNARSAERRGSVADYAFSAWAVAELTAACWVGSAVWTGQEMGAVGWYGSAVLAAILARQTLRPLI